MEINQVENVKYFVLFLLKGIKHNTTVASGKIKNF